MHKFVVTASLLVLVAASACGGNSTSERSSSVLGPSDVAARPSGGGGGGGKGGGKGGGGTTGGDGSGTLSLRLLVDANGNGVPSWRDTVGFNVTSTSTSDPFVLVNCYQGGVKVFGQSHGFFPTYPWPQQYYLSSGAWTGGAADCTAQLYTTPDGQSMNVMATLNFRAE